MFISLIFMNYRHLVYKVLNESIEKTVLNIHNPNVNLISKYCTGIIKRYVILKDYESKKKSQDFINTFIEKNINYKNIFLLNIFYNTFAPAFIQMLKTVNLELI